MLTQATMLPLVSTGGGSAAALRPSNNAQVAVQRSRRQAALTGLAAGLALLAASLGVTEPLPTVPDVLAPLEVPLEPHVEKSSGVRVAHSGTEPGGAVGWTVPTPGGAAQPAQWTAYNAPEEAGLPSSAKVELRIFGTGKPAPGTLGEALYDLQASMQEWADSVALKVLGFLWILAGGALALMRASPLPLLLGIVHGGVLLYAPQILATLLGAPIP